MSEWLSIAETIAVVASVVGTVSGATYWLGRKLASLEDRVAGLERKFGGLESRFTQLENRVAGLELAVGKLEARITQLERKVGNLEERLSALELHVTKLEERMEQRIGRVEEKVSRLGRGIRSVNELFLDIFGYEGVLRAEAVTFAKSELARVLELAENPLTKEEWSRLKQLLEKDDLNLEEAQELYRIADKLVEEHGDRIEVWKLLWYSRLWIGINWRRMAEQRKKAQQQAAQQA